ncbi:MAG TPA: HAMP domain-containing sensor histidine kinase [Actinomycetes bacterium]|jgi:signal transduction histidine kinase|nr:HAMP domain-containing sensor histidine kinase [Actinomycetes bacterium]
MTSQFRLALPSARRTPTGFEAYLVLVGLAGSALLVRLLPEVATAARDADLSFWVLAACVLPAELIRIPVWRRNAVYQITMSRPFALALLTGWGVPLAVVVFMIASVVSDLLHRKSPLRISFNAGQYALSIGAAGVVYEVLGGHPPLGLEQVPAFVAATIVLMLVNRLLVRTGLALLERRPLTPTSLLAGTQVELVEGAIQFSMVLVALLVAEHRLVLPIVLAVPALPMYVAGRAADRAEALSRDYAEQLLHYRHLFVVAERFRRQAEAGSGVNSLQLAAMALDLRNSTSMLKSLLGTIHREAERRDLGLLQDLAGNGVEHTEQLAAKLDQLQASAAAQRAEPAPQLVDATELVNVAEQLAKTICAGRPVVAEAPSDSLPVCLNQDEILDVLGNLVLNAHRYAPPETPIHIGAVQRGDRVVLSVEDEGVEVPPEERERIFGQSLCDGDPVPNSRLGHGLAMARQLAHANSGELRAVDPEDAGGRARFELRLPLANQIAPPVRDPAGAI